MAPLYDNRFSGSVASLVRSSYDCPDKWTKWGSRVNAGPFGEVMGNGKCPTKWGSRVNRPLFIVDGDHHVVGDMVIPMSHHKIDHINSP